MEWLHRLSRLGVLLTCLSCCTRIPAQTTSPVSESFKRQPHDFVSLVTMDGLMDQPANLLNLQGSTLRFKPAGQGGYGFTPVQGAVLTPCRQILDDAQAQGPHQAQSWAVPLPFAFPFAGKSWSQLYVSRNGCVTFSKPEGEAFPARDPWSDGGMCSVAAAIDARSAAGLEEMIAVLWGTYDPDEHRCQISVGGDGDAIAITWNVLRINWGQAPAGPNHFQLRLHKSGEIEMAYSALAESDGIVGLFCGAPISGRSIGKWQHDGSADPSVDIDSAEIFDAGSVLRFVLTMKSDVPTHLDHGSQDYRCFLGNAEDDSLSLTVGEQPPQAKTSCTPSPGSIGFHILGKTAEMDLSKLCLANKHELIPRWNVIHWGKANLNLEKPAVTIDTASLGNGETDFSQPHANCQGNVFEVFHYARVSKQPERLLRRIYANSPAEDDIALVFTDFRIDDFYGIGGGASPSNVAITGIGEGAAHPRSTADLHSTALQMSIATVWIGGAKFAETGNDDANHHWKNFAHGVAWIAHECTHRWGMHIGFRDPQTGQTQSLSDGTGHWLEGLDTTSAVPMADHFLDRPVIGGSIMGGSAWHENADGTFIKSNNPNGMASGLSPLDLYVMGFRPANKVPPMLLIENLKTIGFNQASGSKRIVRIDDIIAAMGERSPTVKDSQKTFRMTMYLLHDPAHPANPASVTRARALCLAVAGFFKQASGGAMNVVPAH